MALPVRRTVAVSVASLSAAAALALPLALASPAQSVPDPAAVAAQAARANTPLIFGHRGASGYRPEHTLASYDLAIRMGADVIEPDLVSTKDHVLVARHENYINETTDVASHPEFADRKATKTIDGVALTGWFTEDFTLAELRTLRAVERLPDVRQENTTYDGRYQVPTFQQVLDLAKKASKTNGRTIGVAPETKHPTYFDSIGLSLEEPLVETLRSNDLDRRDSMVYVQSFEESNLRDLRRRLGLRTNIVQLTGATGSPYDHTATGDPQTYADLTTPAGLREVAQYADVLGPDKNQIFPRAVDGSIGTATALVPDAHRAGLDVVPYTFRAENVFLPLQERSSADPTAFGDLIGELKTFLGTGIDGFFTDQSDIGFAAREDVLGYPNSVNHPQAIAAPRAAPAPSPAP